ncbi:ABC transporter ATP-binding protein [Parachlamydia acanthamoebae]|jgi:oligopeptide/dipeptide ABC transporter ATP-binding protein|uniref:ABC transporter ATP-binding protein n=1 Tax=Parachlamydia acanthamoebae TaxID=83552 RepID=UPI0024E1A031|nr:ABC transporter ATP-binding protein [Parachlamydia acanthamoebae]
MTDTSKPVLQVRHLHTYFQVGKKHFPVVQDVSFDLHAGKTLAIVGESGCGKTVTALSIMRILPVPPALHPKGEILYRNRNLLEIPEKEMARIRGASIAMIFQDPTNALNPVYTIGEQLLEIVEMHLNIYEDEATARVIKALKDVGISSPEDRLQDYPHQLSGGMKQRVMIAMALVCEPDILIADEPTTALDVTIQAQVLDLMRDLQHKKGMAILLITHDMGIVAEIANEVAVMYASEIIERGPVENIFGNMAHPYTVGLFNSRPGGDHERGRLNVIKGAVPPFTHYPKGCRFHPRCPYVMGKCKEGEVLNFAIESSLHDTKCWLYDQTSESQDRLFLLSQAKPKALR